ncbi:MAG: Gfo/Idh/MocA family protein [Cyclobacteriaceae bacterium]
MNKTIRWGILGCGKIARKFASDLALVKNAKLFAVAARSTETATEFAKEFNASKAYGSYQELVADSDVDVIYITTPHALHYEHVMLCLQHKKAVLCEKAFAINANQTKEMIALARSQNVFLMEAFWTRFLPPYLKVKELIREQKIGTIQYIHAEFGFKPAEPISQRIYDLNLGGGSLLDIGVYPVFLALDLLGAPDEIFANGFFASTGADEQCAVQFRYHSGATAQLFSSFQSHLATGADIVGDHGRLRLTHRFHGPTTQLEFYPSTVDTREVIPFELAKGFGYEYEAQHVTDCLLNNLKESSVRKLEDTLLLMETLDRIRKKMGLHYPADDVKS